MNLLAFSGFPKGRRAQLDFLPVGPAAFKGVAKQNKWKLLGPKKGIIVQGEDRAGALADLLGKLAEAKINVTATDAICAGVDRYGAILWVKPRDLKRSVKALGLTST